MRYLLAPMVLAAVTTACTDGSQHEHHSQTYISSDHASVETTSISSVLVSGEQTVSAEPSVSDRPTLISSVLASGKIIVSAEPTCIAGSVVTTILTETFTTTLFNQTDGAGMSIAAATSSGVIALNSTLTSSAAISGAASPSTPVSVSISSVSVSSVAVSFSIPVYSSFSISSIPVSKVQSTSSPTSQAVAPTQIASGVVVITPFAGFENTDKDQGKLPALGWNSWNAYRGNINASIIEKTAQNFIDLGLKDAGYEYVNMDDYWGDGSGRGSDGKLRADATKFPDGIAGVVDTIHSLGLKAGIYSSASVKTCGGYPASLDHEEIDAATFASWGIDYLKYDNCQDPSANPGVEIIDEYDFCTPANYGDTFNGSPVVNGSCAITSRTAPAGYDWTTSNTYHRYANMSKALKAQDHEILFSLCDWGWADVRSWGASLGSSWRTVGDIQSDWGTIMGVFNQAAFMSNSVDFWGHNDPDTLEVGNGIWIEESRSHFALWAAMKAPLLISTDLESLTSDELAVLKNKYLLAFHQDPVYGKPAVPFNWDWSWNRSQPSAHYWSGQSSEGILVLMFNPSDNTETMTAKWTEVPELNGVGGSYEVTDIWTGEMTCVADAFTSSVIRHDTAGAIVGKSC